MSFLFGEMDTNKIADKKYEFKVSDDNKYIWLKIYEASSLKYYLVFKTIK